MEQAIVTIQANGQTTQIAIPLDQVTTVTKYVNKAANPKKFSEAERRAHILEMCASENGATIHEIALKYDTGEQNKYNPAIKKLMEEGAIYREGKRQTASGGKAHIHYLKRD